MNAMSAVSEHERQGFAGLINAGFLIYISPGIRRIAVSTVFPWSSAKAKAVVSQLPEGFVQDSQSKLCVRLRQAHRWSETDPPSS